MTSMDIKSVDLWVLPKRIELAIRAAETGHLIVAALHSGTLHPGFY